MPAILVNDVSPVISYTATAGQTLFSVPFEFFAVQDIVVERAGVVLTYSPTPANNTQYSVIGANLEGGGSITLGSPGATLGDKIVIFRDVTIERLANYPETGPMAVRSLNAEQAKHIAMMQQLDRDITRSISVPIGESAADLPPAASRANKFLAFNASGEVFVSSGISGEDSAAQDALFQTELARDEALAAVVDTQVIADQLVVDAQAIADQAVIDVQAIADQAIEDSTEIVQNVSDALAAGTISNLIGTRIYTSRSALNADLVPADNLYALVVGDATAANNDLYQKNGATTVGSWDGPLGIFAAASASAQAQAAIATTQAGLAATSAAAAATARDDTLAQAFVSFNNALSSGNRLAEIELSFVGTSGGSGLLFDGDSAANAIQFNNSFAVLGTAITFRFKDGLPRVIRTIRHIQSSTATTGTFKIMGSVNGIDFVQLVASVVIGGATQQDIAISNNTPYLFYRVEGISGTSTATHYWREWLLQVGLNNDATLSQFIANRVEANGAQAERLGLMARQQQDYGSSFTLPQQVLDTRVVLRGSAGVALSTTADAGGNKIDNLAMPIIGASSHCKWPPIGRNTSYDPDGYYYLYIVPRSPERARDIDVSFWQNDAAMAPLEYTVDRSVYGVVRVVYRNRAISNGTSFANTFPRITNLSATELPIYWPFLTVTDSTQISRIMTRRFADDLILPTQDIRSFEFWRDPSFFEIDFDKYIRPANTITVDSVNGNNSNAGTRFAPFQTLSATGGQGTLANGATIALRRGSLWREQLTSFYGAEVSDVAVIADDRNNVGRMPTLSAWLPISNSGLTDNGDGTFTFTFTGHASSRPAMDATANNGYHRVLVRERNIALDAADKPIGAGTVLRWVANSTDLLAAPGRALATLSGSTWTVRVNPRTGVGFGASSGVTYEVTDKRSLILQATGSTNDKNLTVAGLHLDGAADGYGMLASGTGSKTDFCVLTGGDVHHSVQASATFTRSLIASVGDVSDTITVAYSNGPNMADAVNVFSRCFVFSKGAPYAHNGVGESSLSKAMLYDRCYTVGSRLAISNAAGGGLGAADQCPLVTRRYNYARNIFDSSARYTISFVQKTIVEDNFIDGVVRVQATPGGTRSNIFITQNYGDRTVGNPANRGVQGCGYHPGGVFENNIMVVTHENGNFVPSGISNFAADYGASILRSGQIGNALPYQSALIRRNIFIVYIPFGASQGQGTNIIDSTTSGYGNIISDENVFIFLDVGSALTFAGPSQGVAGPPLLFNPTLRGGTANDITLNSGSSLSSNPVTIVFQTGTAANTGAATVAIDGLTAVSLLSSTGTPLVSGALAANTRYSAKLVSGNYHLLTFQTHTNFDYITGSTGNEANSLFIDARGHPLGLNAVFRDYARRDLRWANTEVVERMLRWQQNRIRNGLPSVGPTWTIDRNVEQITSDDAYHMISRRAALPAS